MAISSTTIFEVQNGGADTNAGGFNPGNASMATDLTATSGTGNSPVVSSASYTFIAADVGAWLFVKSGTNWNPGWYKISSVSAGAATVDATIDKVPQYAGTTGASMNTVAGIATVASPTTGTWTVDYSQSTPISFTDLVAATTTTFTSVANPIGKNMVGNTVNITAGTGWNLVRWEVGSVAGTTGTATNFSSGSTIATASSTGGTGPLGGPFATPGGCALVMNGISAQVFTKYNASAYVATSATINIAAGCVSCGNGANFIGYDTHRTKINLDANRPTFQVNAGVSAATLFASTMMVANFILDGNSQTTSRGSAAQVSSNCKMINCTNSASSGTCFFCEATGCSTQTVFINSCVGCVSHGNSILSFNALATHCVAYGNTATGFQSTVAVNCIAYGNTGASSDGFNVNGTSAFYFINCISEGNGRYGYNASLGTAMYDKLPMNCTSYNNSSGNNWAGSPQLGIAITALSGSPFVDAANQDFRLNNTAGAGALCRALGFPIPMPSLNASFANYLDIGVAQHQDTGGGSVIVIED